MGIGSFLFLEWPARRHTVRQMAQTLERSGIALSQRFAQLADNERNRQVLNHIIGIERWGQSRLRVALGDAFVPDEYNGYRPARESDWPTLKQQFTETRAQTTALAHELDKAGVTKRKIRHNMYGEISVKGWLRYLNVHANLESKKMR
ncbi:MAG: DinB family protein [Chloroflexi bacterium]|nr:DinB family protein [Chloroflexota bacterium]